MVIYLVCFAMMSVSLVSLLILSARSASRISRLELALIDYTVRIVKLRGECYRLSNELRVALDENTELHNGQETPDESYAEGCEKVH